MECSNAATFSVLFIVSDRFCSSKDVDAAAELFGLESIFVVEGGGGVYQGT